jgi:hypothetical protein
MAKKPLLELFFKLIANFYMSSTTPVQKRQITRVHAQVYAYILLKSAQIITELHIILNSGLPEA